MDDDDAPRPARIRVTDDIALWPWEIVESFVRSTGPGGQHVNKTESAVQLRFDVAHSPSLPNDVRARLARLAGRRLNQDGVLILVAQGERSQLRNRAEALERLLELIRAAARPPVPRRATKPTKGSKRRRLESKKRRGAVKALRQGKPELS
jgi:ribosome-associated protein